MKSVLVALVVCLVFATLAFQEAEAGCSESYRCCRGWWWYRTCGTCYKKCPVDGGWSDWGEFTSCSDKCEKMRKRSCTNPRPANGGKYCDGKSEETQKCFEGRCLEAACDKAKRKGNGFKHSLPGSCANFVMCDFNANTYTKKVCEKTTVWSDEIQGCVHSHDTSKCDEEEKCKDGERIPDPQGCSTYLKCVHGKRMRMPCAPGTYFDSSKKECLLDHAKTCIQ